MPVRHLRRPLLAAAVAMLLATTLSAPARADFNDGVVAHAMGDYDRALQTLLPLAETSDHAFAQYYVGVMYANGQGVSQDYKLAAKWYRGAAEKGIAAAQTKLGLLYAEGLGVPRDMEFAYAWFTVAAKLGNAAGAEHLARSRGQMSAEELAQAEKLAVEYAEKYAITPPDPNKPTSGPPQPPPRQ